MLSQKIGYPEEGEFVMCDVTGIQNYSAFVRLSEYKNKTGMIHISEIAAGRIKNINDHLKEGKLVVCKVLRIDKVKNHIDLSLRRVAIHQQKRKLEEVKQEQKANKLIAQLAKEVKQPPEKIREILNEKILTVYNTIFLACMDVVMGEVSLEELDIDKSLAVPFTKIILDRLKPTEVTIAGTLELSSFAPDGVEKLKSILKKAEKQAAVHYVSGGKYKIRVIDTDYKSAEKKLTDISSSIIQAVEKIKGVGVFHRK